MTYKAKKRITPFFHVTAETSMALRPSPYSYGCIIVGGWRSFRSTRSYRRAIGILASYRSRSIASIAAHLATVRSDRVNVNFCLSKGNEDRADAGATVINNPHARRPALGAGVVAR